MFIIRKSAERGLADHGWLKSRHTFSFSSYFDPQHMGFRTLRVINEDRIAGGTGFGTHSHHDMEIISYVVKGGLKHKDSMGNQAIILPGEVQRLSAGTGITHSEHNNLPDSETHFFQIWIEPYEKGKAPGYGQKTFEAALDSGKLVLVISPDGRSGSIDIRQDVDLYISRLGDGETIDFVCRPGRGLWIQVVRGQLGVNDILLAAGDGMSAEDEQSVRIQAHGPSEILLFDLA
jgi:redox-sensitive bicupin YhaK (pirin superfamily)